jgi:hypothetical protein
VRRSNTLGASHRSLTAEALLVRGVHLEGQPDTESCHTNELTPFAKVHCLEITHPADGNPELFSK